MDNKKFLKIVKFLLLTSFITFTSLYISQAAGYYDYKNYKKTSLTNDQIKEFEQDVKKGKKVDIKKYIDINNKSYQNKISSAGLKISKTSERYIQKLISESFKVLSKLVGE